MNLITIYLITQLWSNSVGLTALYSLKPEIENKIKNKGYKINNKASKTRDIVMLFVPFYYMTKGLGMAYSNTNIDKYIESLRKNKKVLVDKEIINKNAVLEDDDQIIDNVFKAETRDYFSENMGYTYRAENRNIYERYADKEINPFIAIKKEEKVIEKQSVSIEDLVSYVDSLPSNEVEEITETLNSFVLAKKNCEK